MMMMVVVVGGGMAYYPLFPSSVQEEETLTE